MKDFETKITSVEKFSSEYLLLSMEVPEDFDFSPGQFVRVSIPGFNNEKGIPIKRAYSMTSSNLTKGRVELCIGLADKGVFTSKIVSSKAGSSLRIEGPYGKFSLEKPLEENSIFIAEGSRISPLMSMIRTIYLEHPSKNLQLYYGIPSEKDFLYREELEGYSKRSGLKLSVSAQDKEGSIEETVERKVAFQQTKVYVCARPEKVKLIVNILKQKRFGEEQIKKEQW